MDTTTKPSANGHARPPSDRRVANAVERTLRNPTSGYQPTGGWWGAATAAMDGAPVFTWLDIPRMLRDPRVRLAERMWRAPFQRVKWKVKAEHPKIAQFVGQTLRRIWRTSLPRILSRYFRYGYAPGGAEFCERKGLIRLDRVRSIEPRDAMPRVWKEGPLKGQAAGFVIGNGAAMMDMNDQHFVGPRHAVWFAGYQEHGQFYDMAPMSGLFEPWLEKRGRNGAVHARRLWYRKCAFNGGQIYHPPGTTNIGTDESPNEIDNQDLARQLLEYFESGAILTFVNELNQGGNGDYAWKYIPATAQPDVKGVREYPQDLDGEMLEGIGMPKEVLEAADVGSGWSGRLIPLIGFLGGVDELAGMLIECFDSPIRHAVGVNFGESTYYEIEPQSLAEEVQAQAKGGPGGSEGANPLAGMFGGGGKEPAPNPTPTMMSDGRSDVWDAAVRQAKRKARYRRQHARELSWEPYKGSHGGQGWKNPDSGEIRYQTDKPDDGKGGGDVPGDAATIHKSADSKAKSILAAAIAVPKHVMGKVRDKVKTTYGKLSTRYGPRYAKAIVAAGLTGLPIPLPGASMMMAAPVIAVAELHRQFSKGGASDRAGAVDPTVVKPAAKWFVNRVLGKARATLHLSWAASGPVLLADGRADDKPQTKPADAGNAAAWAPHGQSRSGTNRWINGATGEVRYQESKPGEHSTAGAETLFSGHKDYDALPEHPNGPKLDAATAKAIRDEYHAKAVAAGVDPNSVHRGTADGVANEVDKHAVYAHEYNRLNPQAKMVFGRLNEPKQLREHYESNLKQAKIGQETERFDREYFNEDDPRKRAKAWIKGASGKGDIDPENLSGDTIDAISEDLAVSLNHKQLLSHYADMLDMHGTDTAGATAVEQALAKKPPAAPVAFDGRKPEKWVTVYAGGSDVPEGVLAAIPKASVNLQDGSFLIPAKDAIAAKILEAHGVELLDTDTDEGAGELFDAATASPIVADKDVPASAKDYGTTSGHLDPNKVGDDWNPNAVDVYKRINRDWFVVKRGEGNPDADESGIFGIVHRSSLPPTSRLPDAYWKGLTGRSDASTDSDAQERTRVQAEKASREGTLDKYEFQGTNARYYTREAAKVKAAHTRIGNAVRSIEALHAKAIDLGDGYSFGDDDVKTADNGSYNGPAISAMSDLESALDELRTHDAPEFDYDPDDVGDFDASALSDQHGSRADHREVADQVYEDWNEYRRESEARTRESLADVRKVAPEYRAGLRDKLQALRKAAQTVMELPDGVLENPQDAKSSAAEINRMALRLIGRTMKKAHLMSDGRSDADDSEHKDIQNAAGKLMHKRKKDLVQLIAIAMLKAQERATAAGRPQSAAPYLESLGSLAADPSKVQEIVGGAKLLSWSPYEGPKGGHGWKNDETGRIVYGTGGKPGEKREKQQASGTKAKEILGLIGKNEATPEHLEELADHLPALNVQQLRSARARLNASWGGSRMKRESMINTLLGHVRETVQEMRANPNGAPEPEPTPRKEQQFRPKAGKVYTLPTESLHVDPARFQFKLNTNAAGVTDELKQVEHWNPDFAGVVSAWLDPQDGKTYIVNGHHRRERAGQLGVKDLAVRFLDAKDAKEARAKGALINIAEGRGTAIDAAKFMRDTGVTVDDFAKHGVPLKAGALADQATTLTKLNDKAFDRVARGDLEVSKALAVAKHLDNPERQEKLFKLLEKREDEGKDISPRTMEEMARAMAAAPSVTKTESTLWGPEETTEDVFVQRAELAGSVRTALAQEMGNWAAVSSAKRAASVADAGNTLNVDENKKRAEAAEQGKNLYDTLVNRKGPISDALNAGAVKLANAKTKKERERARAETTDAIRGAIRGEFDALNRKPGEVDGGREGGAIQGDQGSHQPAAGGAAESERPAAERTGLIDHATADHTPALEAIQPGGNGYVAGHFVRRTADGKHQIETPKGYATGTAAEIGDRIRRNWNDQKPESGGIRRAMERSGAYQDADPFMDQKGSEREAKARAAVPHGTRAVSLDENTKGRVGSVVRDPETGQSHLLLDGGTEAKATDFEPLDEQHSWRGGAKKDTATVAPKPEAKPLFDESAEGVPSAKAEPAAPTVYQSNGLPFRGHGELADDALNASHLPAIEKRIESLKESSAAAHEQAKGHDGADPFHAADLRSRAEGYDELRSKLEAAKAKLTGGASPATPAAVPSAPMNAPTPEPKPDVPVEKPTVPQTTASNPTVAGAPVFGGYNPETARAAKLNHWEHAMNPEKAEARRKAAEAESAAFSATKGQFKDRVTAAGKDPAAWAALETDFARNEVSRQDMIDLSKSLFPHLHDEAKRLPKAKIVALMKRALGVA